MNSKTPFKIHLYKLAAAEGSISLEDMLQMIDGNPLGDRVRKLGYQSYRLEEVILPTDEEPYWIADFTKMRHDGGPGKASKATPVESFDMAGGFGFAEETAMLYDAKAGFIIMQYNHHGPRAQSISEYLSIYDSSQANSYELLLQLNPSAQARLNNKKLFTRLKIRVAPSKLSQAYRKANVGLVTALESQTNLAGGDFVFVDVGLDRENKGSLKLKKLLPAFLKLANYEHEAVSALQISGRDEPDFPIDMVDLIGERLQSVIKSMPLDDGLRYPKAERYKALKRAYNGWKKDKIIS